ncbi:MAG TPA: DUF5686 family protein [Flavisolibacter sp.]|nr:DUF5686 family protein [Flavisolibacter sp.]
MDHQRYYVHFHKWLFSVFLLFIFNTAFAQTYTVSGIVIDADTKDPVPYASVFFKGGKGVTADSTGHFEISTSRILNQLVISYIGYKSKTVSIRVGVDQTINVELEIDESKDLGNVVIKSKKKINYRNKDNPAVELIRRVIANREKNRPEYYDYVEYEQYEKLQLSLSRISDRIANVKLLKSFRFLFENVDSTKIPGKALIPIYLEEKVSTNYYRKNPEKRKTIIEVDKKVNYGEFVDSNGVSSYLNRLYEDVDIYDDNISLFTREFLSPIADMAPTFYMFFIRDTVTEPSGKKLVRMNFTPRNTNDFLFRGTIFITLDTNYAVQKLNMTVSPNINLNLVREMYINQEFELNPDDGKYHIIKSNVLAEASLSKRKSNGIFGERTVSYKNYRINQPRDESFYAGPSTSYLTSNNRDSILQFRRHDKLSVAESKVYSNTDSLKRLRSFRRFMDVANILLAGYKNFGKFEIGPANTFYSFNPIEGFRLRFGGRTTPKLSKRIYFETYGAYGFKDEKWKGFAALTYSLNNKSIYTFPLNYVKASVQRETRIPGYELQFVQEDNFLLSFKRGKNDKWLYNTIYRVNYVHELASHFTYDIGFKNWRQEPAGAIEYVKEQNSTWVKDSAITTTDLSLDLRWAPNEQFYQGTVFRTPIINKYPVFRFRYLRGIKGAFKGQYNYHNLNLSISKRVYMSQFGNSDMILEGGYIFGRLPYPLLTVHRANQTYAYQLASYNLMNFLEFVSDRYVSINIDHHFNGFIFNRLPLIRHLDLREVVTAKVLYGGIRSENDPAKNTDLYRYPAVNGIPTTFSLNDGPYIEGSVGISNIFKLLRVDVVKRFTYRDHPDIAKWGIRGRVRFEF